MRKVIGAGLCALGLMFGAANNASGALVINEMVINPPGTDDPNEWVEVKGNASESTSNVWLLWVDGDAAGAAGFGIVINAVQLTGGTVGTNGLYLVYEGAALSPTPAAATTLQNSNWTPDLDNDTGTMMLVTNFTGTANLVTGSDIDTNDDGTVDATFWTTVLDTVAYIDNGGGTQVSFADDFGGTTFAPAAGYNPDYFGRIPALGNAWITADIVGTNPGPYTLDVTNVSNAGYGGQTITPGNVNSTMLDVEISETSID